MSCAFYLDEVDKKAPLPFQGRFLKYRLLRQMLNTAASLPSGPQRAAVEKIFMSSLQLQATDVNRCERRKLSLPAVLARHPPARACSQPRVTQFQYFILQTV
jgi:hypothetical protein